MDIELNVQVNLSWVELRILREVLSEALSQNSNSNFELSDKQKEITEKVVNLSSVAYLNQ